MSIFYALYQMNACIDFIYLSFLHDMSGGYVYKIVTSIWGYSNKSAAWHNY